VRHLLVSIYRDKNAPPTLPVLLSPPRSACGTSRARKSAQELSQQFDISSDRVLARLHKLRGLRLLSPPELRKLLERGRHSSHARYSYIAREGATCSGVTIVIAGEVECSSQSHGIEAEHVPPGHTIGEPALLTGHALRHEHTLKAISDVYTFTLRHSDFEGLRLSHSPSDHTNANARILGAMPFFVSVEPANRRKLGALLEMQFFRLSFTYPDPTPVVREGEEGAPFYFLIEGTVALHRRASDGVAKDQLGTLTPDSRTPWFGNIEGGPSPASAVVATEPCLCLVLKADKAAQFLAHAPGFARVVREADAALLRPAHHHYAAQA
jgi:CRP-like cAMP-binding protein